MRRACERNGILFRVSMVIKKFCLVIDNSLISDEGAAAVGKKILVLILQQAMWQAIRSEMEKPIGLHI